MAVDTARVEKLRKQSINGQSMKRLVEAGMIWLRTNQQTVNALNVFPVPDGDTGTNMVLTMQSAWNEIKDLGHRSISDMAAAVSKGALMGARGNSGVILSQLWRGFARGVHGHDVLDGATFAKAFAEARDWDQFHSPKNLSMALMVEVAELMEHFQWLTEAQSGDLAADKKAVVAEELADILLYLVRLADKLDVDLKQAALHKLEKNAAKYPAEQVRGSAKKYSEY